MFSKLKQIKDLRDKAKEMQTTLGAVTVEGSADWGKVKVSMDGNMKVHRVMIDDVLLANKSKLETNLQEAINEAVKKVQKVMMEKMKSSGNLEGILGK